MRRRRSRSIDQSKSNRGGGRGGKKDYHDSDDDDNTNYNRRTKSLERTPSRQASRQGALSYDDDEDYATPKGRHSQFEHGDEQAPAYNKPRNGNGGKQSGFFGKRWGGGNGNGGGNGKSTEFTNTNRQNEKFYSHTLAAVSDIEKLAQKKGANPLDERFKVMPDHSYHQTYLNREELRAEMNKKSEYFHDLRVQSTKGTEIGQLRFEVLQCFGIPTYSLIRETSAYCIAVCGNHAFKTDVMPPVANPMWLCKMRRAALFPVVHAYARLFIGVFDNAAAEGSNSDFVGRAVVDISRLRPGCTYDFTVPLRQSAHVFTRQQQGAVRVRLHLIWQSERSAIMSYIPKNKPKFQPNEKIAVNCLDERSFKNVANVVHGTHMPGKFSMTLLKATIREINFTRIHVMRYVRKREVFYLVYWQYPFISGFVFMAWMHCVYANTIRFLPGHILSFFLLHLYKNYAYYGMDSALQNGFMAPTFEELFNGLLRGSRKRRYIEPLNMEMDDSHAVNPLEHMEAADDYEEANPDSVPLSEVAESMRKSIRVRKHKYRLRTYKNCFTGIEAVDFLVTFGYAYSREEAVYLGKRLAREVRLFEHVARQHDFDDKPHFYHFLEYDTKKYVIKGHKPRGKALLKAVGFLKEDEIHEPRGHVEFPFATGQDHPRFTVKQSLVIRSAEAKKIMKDTETQMEIADCAEFGVVPIDLEHHNVAGDIAKVGVGVVTGAVGVGVDVVRGSVGAVREGVRRASLIGGMATNISSHANSNHFMTESERTPDKPKRSSGMNLGRDSVEYGDPGDIYDKLKARQNPTLDELLEEREKANMYDKFAYDSDEDVDNIIKQKRKGIIIEEKMLKKPPTQDIGVKSGKGDKSFAKTIQEARHKAHGLLLHLFHVKTYTIDTTLFPPTLPEDNTDRDSVASMKAPKNKRRMPRLSAAQKQQEEEKKKKKKSTITPYDAKQDEYDKILGINKYSHANPWINRVGVIVQPIVEIVQGWLYLFRAVFNLFTWQDPILSFWVAFMGPVVVLALHCMPYRILFGVAGLVMVGPQNWILRLLRESRSDYEPPDFDKLIRKKKPKREENYMDVQFFSSEAPGNQTIKYKNVEPKQVKKVVVPYSQLKFNRFYDWPPEPEYARVYASPPPRNTVSNSNYNSDSDASVEDSSYWYDPALVKKKQKKKKKGVKKLASQVKKGTGTVVFAGSELVRNTTVGAVRGSLDVTKNAVKGTTKVTKRAVKGTAKATKGAVKGTARATTGVVKGAGQKAGGLFGLRHRRHKGDYSDDDESYD